MPSPSALRRRKEERDLVVPTSGAAAPIAEESSAAAEPTPALPTDEDFTLTPVFFEQVPPGGSIPREDVEVKFAVNEETGVLEISGVSDLAEGLRFDIGDIRLIEGLIREANQRRLSALEMEVKRLEEKLREARDETAQKNNQIMRLEPFEQEALELKEEQKLLRGEYEAKDSPALADFWEGFNLFFGYAKTLTSEAQRVKAQESTIEQMQDEVRKLKTTLYQRERVIESLKEGDEFPDEAELGPPASWVELTEQAKNSLKGLLLSSEIAEMLTSCPFNPGVAESVQDLLRILDSVVSESKDDCSLTERGLQIREQHFVGKNAPFSDESDTNKRAFRSDLTFRDPADPSKRIECTWHGKVSQEQFRVHFEWPRPKGQRIIKVVYIGPKLTKH
jgi:hypothetical protein